MRTLDGRSRHLPLLAVTALIAACGTPAPSASTAIPSSAAPPGASARPAATPGTGEPRTVVVDTDLGADDLTALAVLLRDPGLDVRAITVAGTGLVHCAAGQRNLRALLAGLGSSGIPIGCGREVAGPTAYPFPDDWRAGADGAYGIEFAPTPGTEAGGEAAEVIADAVAGSPAPPLVVALGPWTNIADALAVDPGLAGRIAGIHAMGGTIDAPGNVWADGKPSDVPVEFNFGADPDAVAAVLATDVPVTLVPLDATDDLPVTQAFVEALEADHDAAGADLVFELYARSPSLAGEGQFLWDQATAVALLDPGVATWAEATVRAVVDRPNAGQVARDAAGRSIRYASAADPAKVEVALLEALRRGAPRPNPFRPVGTLAVTWDGTTCSTTTAPVTTGLHEVMIRNDDDAPVFLVVAGAQPPRTWDDLLAFAETYDPAVPPPDWILTVAAGGADAGSNARSFADLPAGTFGPVCAKGPDDDAVIVPGSSFTITTP